jgi:putative toxin-antitoxin system antitoxin component (TIGR02293 family)
MPLDMYRDTSLTSSSDTSRLATLLSLEHAADLTIIAMARLISDGLPPSVVKRLDDKLQDIVSVKDIVPETTLRRVINAKSKLSADYSERLFDLCRVIDTVALVYKGDNDKMRQFLTMPHPLLEGEKPLDLARLNSAGADIVIDLLHGAHAGVAL